VHSIEVLKAWLDPLDIAQVECDGMSRVIGDILTRNKIDHTVMKGILIDHGPELCRSPEKARAIPHYWIELASGHLIDYRARMWMGPEAPHGIFTLLESRFEYRAGMPVFLNPLSIEILSLMSGIDLESFPPFLDRP
jgi:hypothetical protein